MLLRCLGEKWKKEKLEIKEMWSDGGRKPEDMQPS